MQIYEEQQQPSVPKSKEEEWHRKKRSVAEPIVAVSDSEDISTSSTATSSTTKRRVMIEPLQLTKVYLALTYVPEAKNERNNQDEEELDDDDDWCLSENVLSMMSKGRLTINVGCECLDFLFNKNPPSTFAEIIKRGIPYEVTHARLLYAIPTLGDIIENVLRFLANHERFPVEKTRYSKFRTLKTEDCCDVYFDFKNERLMAQILKTNKKLVFTVCFLSEH